MKGTVRRGNGLSWPCALDRRPASRPWAPGVCGKGGESRLLSRRALSPPPSRVSRGLPSPDGRDPSGFAAWEPRYPDSGGARGSGRAKVRREPPLAGLRPLGFPGSSARGWHHITQSSRRVPGIPVPRQELPRLRRGRGERGGGGGGEECPLMSRVGKDASGLEPGAPIPAELTTRLGARRAAVPDPAAPQ